jgi:HD-GYP domain-containing protein (c-di-GMP phosphodiesterase class II)
VEVARKEIEVWSGRQFDPNVVRVFLGIPSDVWRQLHKEIDTQQDRFSYSEHLSQLKS